MVYAYSKSRGDIRRLSPRDVFVVRNFHDDCVERAFERLETRISLDVKSILKSCREDAAFGMPDSRVLERCRQLVLSQFFRTPWAKNSGTRNLEERTAHEELVRALAAAGFETNDEETMREAWESEKRWREDAKRNRNSAIWSRSLIDALNDPGKSYPGITKAILDKGVILAMTDSAFVLGDRGAMSTATADKPLPHPDSEIYFPASPHVAISVAAGRRNQVARVTVDRAATRRINRSTVNCSDVVVSYSERLLRSLANARLPPSAVRSVVAFVGDAELKTALPENVTVGMGRGTRGVRCARDGTHRRVDGGAPGPRPGSAVARRSCEGAEVPEMRERHGAAHEPAGPERGTEVLGLFRFPVVPDDAGGIGRRRGGTSPAAQRNRRRQRGEIRSLGRLPRQTARRCLHADAREHRGDPRGLAAAERKKTPCLVGQRSGRGACAMPELAGIGVGGRRRMPTGTGCGAIRPREVNACVRKWWKAPKRETGLSGAACSCADHPRIVLSREAQVAPQGLAESRGSNAIGKSCKFVVMAQIGSAHRWLGSTKKGL